MNRVIAVLLLAASAASAYSALQTDWSGGPGVSGPVPEFRNSFYQGAGIDYSGTPGTIALDAEPTVNRVDSSFPGITSLYACDMDGDGDIDLLGASIQTAQIAWWENTDGAGKSWTRHTIDSTFTGASCVTAADFDGDGDMDVAGASKTQFGPRDIVWWSNDDGVGGSWTATTVAGSFDGAHSVCACDMDGDGDQDILGASAYNDEVAWFENPDSVSGDWAEHSVDSSLDGAWSAEAADIDGDGDLDVIGTGYYADEVVLWTDDDGTGTSWTRTDMASGFDGAYFVCGADVDGNGSMDVLGVSALGGEVGWWDLRGTTWMPHTVQDGLDGAVSAACGDMDSDGDNDVVAAAASADLVRWWENQSGDWIQHDLATGFDGPMSAGLADIDGDGELDAFYGAMNAGVIEWSDRRASSGFLESSILDAGIAPEWDLLDCVSDIPEGCSLSFQVRASNDIFQMGDWSDPVKTPLRLSGILSPGDNYFQYRILLSTTLPDQGPEVYDVTVSWNQQGTGEGDPGPAGVILYPVSPNPCSGPAVIRFWLEDMAVVNLSVWDLSGRLVYTTGAMAMDPGSSQVVVDGLGPGLYMCRLFSGDFTAAVRFAVMR